jgi:hypothetical protein
VAVIGTPYGGGVDYIPVNCDAVFGGLNSYDPDGTIESYEWSLPWPAYDIRWAHTNHDGVTVKFSETGVYYVGLTVTDNQGASSYQAICTVYVFQAEMLIDGCADAYEWEPGKYLLGNEFVKVDLSIAPDNGWLSVGRWQLWVDSGSGIEVWDASQTQMILPDSDNRVRWRWWQVPDYVWVKKAYDFSWLAPLRFGYTPDQQTWPGGGDVCNNDRARFFCGLYMKLEKDGPTTVNQSNNYSEDTTIRITAVNSQGQTIPYFSGAVSIAEQTTSIYTQNTAYGATLPSSVNLVAGTGTIVAKSLAGPRSALLKPLDARIVTTNYPVYNALGYLPVEQWVNNDQYSKRCIGDAFDWFEIRTQDILESGSGDLATVLSKLTAYEQVLTEAYIGQTDFAHTTTHVVRLNPCFVAEMRVDIATGGLACNAFSDDHDHRNTVIHEARHCYMDYLSTLNLGQDDLPGDTPNNDDDRDYLVDVVPIPPAPGSNYMLDTGDSRSPHCGLDPISFHGDAIVDPWATIYDNVLEADAYHYAQEND